MVIMTIDMAMAIRVTAAGHFTQPAWGYGRRMTNVRMLRQAVSPAAPKAMTDAAFEFRDRFGLALVAAHSKLPPCEVVWRPRNTYG